MSAVDFLPPTARDSIVRLTAPKCTKGLPREAFPSVIREAKRLALMALEEEAYCCSLAHDPTARIWLSRIVQLTSDFLRDGENYCGDAETIMLLWRCAIAVGAPQYPHELFDGVDCIRFGLSERDPEFLCRDCGEPAMYLLASVATHNFMPYKAGEPGAVKYLQLNGGYNAVCERHLSPQLSLFDI